MRVTHLKLFLVTCDSLIFNNYQWHQIQAHNQFFGFYKYNKGYGLWMCVKDLVNIYTVAHSSMCGKDLVYTQAKYPIETG